MLLIATATVERGLSAGDASDPLDDTSRGRPRQPWLRWMRVHSLIRQTTRDRYMFDLVMLALGLGLFAAGLAYAYACDRL